MIAPEKKQKAYCAAVHKNKKRGTVGLESGAFVSLFAKYPFFPLYLFGARPLLHSMNCCTGKAGMY